MTPRQRADLLLVERGLFESRSKAQHAIAAGLVTANGVPVRKPADEIAIDAELHATPAHPYVSRGGVKLAAALDRFGIDPAGRVCLDIGASTGGFTEVLVGRGARKVYAVDVGRDQLHERLRGDARIVSMEATDIRKVHAFDEQPDLVVIDVSFISLKHVLPAALALAASRMDLVALIKPQFEAPRSAIKKGIVRDAAVHAAVCEDIADAVKALGLTIIETSPSPIEGGDGNREFLIGAHRG
jgi:23S rRNA (cytidine1920-2'-O)/16S rRNA (cytidine1409-2'-O)-methyltransferase